jgi:hypothetical protein
MDLVVGSKKNSTPPKSNNPSTILEEERSVPMPDNTKKSLFDQIKEGIGSLKTLEIRTIIGKFKWDDKTKQITYQEGEVKVILTQIDLLDGDITTAFSEDFLKEPYDKIREYHADREKRGQEIINGNLKALQELLNLILRLAGIEKELKPGG